MHQEAKVVTLVGALDFSLEEREVGREDFEEERAGEEMEEEDQGEKEVETAVER